MATKYARAGGGNWTADATWSTTSGGAADTTKPTAADDAVLDAASGAVTIDSGAVCRSLDCNGYTGTLTHTAGVILTIGDATAGAGNRALRLVAGMTYTLGSATSEFRFSSSSATVQTVTLAGKTCGNLRTFSSGSWQFVDAITSTYLYHVQGTMDLSTAGSVNVALFDTVSAATRVLTLGSTPMTVTTGGVAWSAATVTGLTATANTATVTLTGAAAGFSGGGQNWNGLSVVMSGSGTAATTAMGTVANFTRTGTAAKTDGLTHSANATVTGTYTITGNSATNRVLVSSTTLGTARTITAATTSLTNVDFRDITAAGAAAWTGTSVGNALGNTGITFTTPVTRYAVATGNVSGTGTWSATSGGASGASVPLCHDTIICNAASGSITVTNDMPRMCADLTCTGYTGTFTNGTTSSMFGSLTFGSGMTIGGSNQMVMYGRSSHTITSAGKSFGWNFVVGSGTYTLADAFTNTDNFTLTFIGTFNDGGFNCTSPTYTANISTCTLVSSGTWTITSTGASPYTGAGTVNHTGTIVLSGATATDRTFAGGGKTYGTLTDQNTSTGKLTITGANTFGTINKTATVACTLALPNSATTTVTNFNVNGQAGAVLTLTAA